MTKVYVRVHVGLLDDEDYMDLTPAAKGAWHTVNMLLGALTEPVFRDRRQIVALLRKEGFPDPETVLIELELANWIVPHPDRDGVTLKGWLRYQVESRASELRARRVAAKQANTGDTVSIPYRASASAVPYRAVPDGTEGVQGEPDQQEGPVYDDAIREMQRRGLDPDDSKPAYPDSSRDHPAPDPAVRSMADLKAAMDKIGKPVPGAHPRRRGRAGS